MYALEVYLDEAADSKVRKLWDDIESNGIFSAKTGPVLNARSHIGLAVFEKNKEGYSLYYRPNLFKPHCTLASNASDFSVLKRSISSTDLPIEARIESVGLIEVPNGNIQFKIKL